MSPSLPSSRAPTAPAVLFFGMSGQFSLVVLNTLLASGIDVCSVIVPAPPTATERTALRAEEPPELPSKLPLLTRFREPSIVTRAQERGIPAWSLAGDPDDSAVAMLAAVGANTLSVACWPRRLPQALLRLVGGAALNVHPSLLPRHRGPEPLFWTLRHGDTNAGVSVHLLTETLDGGPLMAQTSVPIPEGVAGADLEHECAHEGGRLLAEALCQLAAGQAQPVAQADELATYEGVPTANDFVVTQAHSASWAFTFIRAAAYWGGPMVIWDGVATYTVASAVSYTAERSHGDTTVRRGDELWFPCTPGTLHVLLA